MRVRMEQEAITRRAWLQKGKRTVMKVDRDKQAQSYIGFLNQKTFTCEIYEMPWQNQEEVLAAFGQFLKQHSDKQIAIIWDNAAFHKGKLIRAALAKGQLLERVHLIPMLPTTTPLSMSGTQPSRPSQISSTAVLSTPKTPS